MSVIYNAHYVLFPKHYCRLYVACSIYHSKLSKFQHWALNLKICIITCLATPFYPVNPFPTACCIYIFQHSTVSKPPYLSMFVHKTSIGQKTNPLVWPVHLHTKPTRLAISHQINHSGAIKFSCCVFMPRCAVYELFGLCPGIGAPNIHHFGCEWLMSECCWLNSDIRVR